MKNKSDHRGRLSELTIYRVQFGKIMTPHDEMYRTPYYSVDYIVRYREISQNIRSIKKR
jgi:hypothetical protein